MGTFAWITWLLVIIGGLNWGLVGFFEFDLLATIFGDMTTITRVLYALVGLSALYMLFAKWGSK
jgi:hypothetical protein